MNEKQELSKARKRWGKKALIQDNGKTSTPELRESAHKAKNAMTRTKENSRKYDKLLMDSIRYRYSVGYNAMGLCFHVSGHGDSWSDAFDKADKAFKGAA